MASRSPEPGFQAMQRVWRRCRMSGEVTGTTRLSREPVLEGCVELDPAGDLAGLPERHDGPGAARPFQGHQVVQLELNVATDRVLGGAVAFLAGQGKPQRPTHS